jgi:secreted trypsin-like serine protease
MISAAHCEDAFKSGGIFSFRPVEIPIGAKCFDGEDAIDTVEVVAVVAHPDYDSSDEGDDHDILLIKLARPSTTPIAEWNRDPTVPAPGDKLTVIGFGLTEENGDTSDELLEVELDVYDRATCDAAVDIEEVLDFTTICAGTEEGGKDSCQGDSGGPVFDKNGVVSAIISRGEGCARPGVPGLNVRLSSYADFIQESICELSGNPPADCPAVEKDTCSNVFSCDRFLRSGHTMHRNILGRCVDTCVTRFESLWECGPCGTGE